MGLTREELIRQVDALPDAEWEKVAEAVRTKGPLPGKRGGWPSAKSRRAVRFVLWSDIDDQPVVYIDLPPSPSARQKLTPDTLRELVVHTLSDAPFDPHSLEDTVAFFRLMIGLAHTEDFQQDMVTQLHKRLVHRTFVPIDAMTIGRGHLPSIDEIRQLAPGAWALSWTN